MSSLPNGPHTFLSCYLYCKDICFRARENRRSAVCGSIARTNAFEVSHVSGEMSSCLLMSEEFKNFRCCTPNPRYMTHIIPVGPKSRPPGDMRGNEGDRRGKATVTNNGSRMDRAHEAGGRYRAAYDVGNVYEEVRRIISKMRWRQRVQHASSMVAVLLDAGWTPSFSCCASSVVYVVTSTMLQYK